MNAWLDSLCFNLYLGLALPKYKIIKHTQPNRVWYKIRECGLFGDVVSCEYDSELWARDWIKNKLTKETERLTNNWYHKTEPIKY